MIAIGDLNLALPVAVPLDADTALTLGRTAEDADVQLPCRCLSKRHVSVEFASEESLLVVKDLGSRNGTFKGEVTNSGAASMQRVRRVPTLPTARDGARDEAEAQEEHIRRTRWKPYAQRRPGAFCEGRAGRRR